MVFAVWDAVVAMSERNLCYYTMVEIFDRNVLLGKLWIAPWSSSMENKGKPLGELNGLEEAPSSSGDQGFSPPYSCVPLIARLGLIILSFFH